MKENKKSIIILSILFIIFIFVYIDSSNHFLLNCITKLLKLLTTHEGLIKDLILGILSGLIVSIITAIINYSVLKRKVISNIWLISNSLYRKYTFLMIDNIELSGNDISKLKAQFKQLCKQKEFIDKLREWEDDYTNKFIPANNELKVFNKKSKLYKSIVRVQDDIALLSNVINYLNFEYVNSKEKICNNDSNFDKVIDIIANIDKDNLYNNTGEHLKELRKYFKERSVKL